MLISSWMRCFMFKWNSKIHVNLPENCHVDKFVHSNYNKISFFKIIQIIIHDDSLLRVNDQMNAEC